MTIVLTLCYEGAIRSPETSRIAFQINRIHRLLRYQTFHDKFSWNPWAAAGAIPAPEEERSQADYLEPLAWPGLVSFGSRGGRGKLQGKVEGS